MWGNKIQENGFHPDQDREVSEISMFELRIHTKGRKTIK